MTMDRIIRHAPRAGLVSCLALILAACDGSTVEPRPGAGEWIDLGALPASEQAWSVVVFDGEAFVGTEDGVLARSIDGSGSWTSAGLEGLEVQAFTVWQHPVPTLWAVGYPKASGVTPVYWTTDGRSWTAGGAGLESLDDGSYLGLADIAVQPASAPDPAPVLYATASGTNIARSTDGGATWTFMVGEPWQMATYDCLIHVLGEHLYQGCEAPLDVAWVRRYDIADRGAVHRIEDGVVVVDDIENRRINGFADFADNAALAGTLFVGVEGGLLALESTGWEWIHRIEDGQAPYTYVRSIWVDPADPRHIVFGGGEAQHAPDRSGLWETFDGGATVSLVQGPTGVDFATAGVPAAVPVGPRGEDLLLLVDQAGRRRLLLRPAPAEE